MVVRVGAWRSLVAHTLGVRVVAGSNPAAPTNATGSYKRSGIKPKACGKRLDLPHVETAAASKQFGDDALATDLGQILLSETVLLHQEAEHLDPGSLRQTVMLPVVGLDKHAQGFDQAITRVSRSVADFVHERVQALDRSVVLPLCTDREEGLQQFRILHRFNGPSLHLFHRSVS